MMYDIEITRNVRQGGFATPKAVFKVKPGRLWYEILRVDMYMEDYIFGGLNDVTTLLPDITGIELIRYEKWTGSGFSTLYAVQIAMSDDTYVELGTAGSHDSVEYLYLGALALWEVYKALN